MAADGPAFLALWNDVDPARDEEYNCWHTFEHVPERVGIAGIVSARRYLAPERGERRYFTLYDLDLLAALDGAEYLDVVHRPTAWSLSMRPSLRNFLRRPCATALRLGHGLGNCIATVRFAVSASIDLVAWTAMLQAQLATSGVCAIRLGRADTTARFPIANATADDAASGAPHVLLMEGIDRFALDAAALRVVAEIAGGMVGAIAGDAGSIAWESYDFAFAIDRAGLPARDGSRQPSREDLRRRWA